MKLKKLRHHILFTAIILTAIAMPSCSDEIVVDIPDYTISGEDITLKVALTLPEMDVKSRANLDATSLNQVNSLWLRTYNSETGLATSDWVKLTPSSSDTEVPRSVEIRSKSGHSYIIAVANVENNGVTRDNRNPTPLSTLLETADTWGDFLNIAAVAPSTQEYVRAPRVPLTMAGCFSDIIVGGTHPEPSRPDEWQTKDFQSFFIPAQNGIVDLTDKGAIHLRRLVSHINFNVKPADVNILSVTVNSFRVMNAPRYSWVYERSATGGLSANYGDLATSEEDADNYYVDVPQYGSQFVTENADGSSSFDYWQAENKHTGEATTYGQRGEKAGETTQHFTALTGGADWTVNNEASYALINCTIEYSDRLTVNNQGEIDANGSQVSRTGEVTYLIHLGAIENDFTDFNCLRNVNYTYNITVNGINDIRVDAFATDETYHNEEGMVVDLDESTIDIDAHYGVFNVQLTQAELSAENFGFIIIAYENGDQYTITDANDQEQVGVGSKVIYRSEDDSKSGGVIDPKYYNWIELRPTTGANVLAEYKPRYGGDGATFLLTDLKGGWNSMTTEMKSTSGYYTVFVNEYTYEPMYTGTDGYADESWNGTGRPTWMSYVNQNPRRFYIRTTQSVSPDGNSIYARSKYGVAQQSLMSYYSEQSITEEGTAIAVERENETLGMNLRHSFGGGTSTSNGRLNAGMWLNNASTTSTNLSINSNNANNRPQWSNYINVNDALVVPAVVTTRLQGGPAIPAKTAAIQKPIRVNNLINTGASATTNVTFSDPQSSNTYNIEAINACISRNRDNNGNGRIEPDELRWYVPAMDQYLHMMLGSNSLPEPMMVYEQIASLPRYNKTGNNYRWVTTGTGGTFGNSYCSRYMYVASNNDKSVMWTMEGTSTSTYSDANSWGGNQTYPWLVRCIRNLGTDMTSVANELKVQPTFIHNTATRTFNMKYYDLASIRTNAYTGNGTGSGQMPIHTIPAAENSTYYGFEYSDSDIAVPEASRPAGESNFSPAMTTYINGNPCSGLGSGWRVPNQEELTIMRNAGNIISHATNANAMWVSCTVNYFSSTGSGSLSTTGKLFLVVTPTQGTQATTDNIRSAGSNVYIRCVRDVMP